MRQIRKMEWLCINYCGQDCCAADANVDKFNYNDGLVAKGEAKLKTN